MRLSSTGLGKTELEAQLVGIKKVDDVVIFFVDVTKPVRWHTRMAFQEKDLKDLVHAILRPRNLWFVVRALLRPHKKTVSTTEKKLERAG